MFKVSLRRNSKILSLEAGKKGRIESRNKLKGSRIAKKKLGLKA